jgi:hypothetical protein
LTSIKTDPEARVLKLTDPMLSHYPLLYMEHAGYMRLSDDEVVALRNYFRGGGALFVNDFWGSEEWNGFASEMNKVLPGRAWTELTTDHPVFNCVYDLRGPMTRMIRNHRSKPFSGVKARRKCTSALCWTTVSG